MRSPEVYLASIAVTSTSIAMLGHANWLTTRNVEAGIGAFPKASPGVLKEAHIRRVGHNAHNIIHCRTLQIEELFDFHVSISALLHKIALMNNFAIALALWANPSKKDEFAWICNRHHF